MLIVGDAFARPLLDELDRRTLRPVEPQRHPAPAARRCRVGAQAGAARPHPDRDDRRRPRLVGGRRPAVATCRRASDAADRAVPAGARAATSSRADLDRVLAPGDDERRLAGQVAAGSPSATSATPTRRRAPTRSSTASATPSPATGPGAAPTAASSCSGRDSVTINSGGEKIFAEEVEQAITRPSRRLRLRRRRTAQRALGQRGRRHRAAARRAPTSPTRPARRRRRAHRPLQAAQGVRVRRRDRPLAVGQGRLPLGPQRRRLS